MAGEVFLQRLAENGVKELLGKAAAIGLLTCIKMIDER